MTKPVIDGGICEHCGAPNLAHMGGPDCGAIAERKAARALPIPCFAYIVQCTEYERGWGSRPDGIVAFQNEKAAEEWIDDYDKKHNNKPVVPDWYLRYDKVGPREVSGTTMDRIMKVGLVHSNNLKDLQS